MSEPGHAIDEATLKFGLLMESAQSHQRLAEAHLLELRNHTQDLDGVVREEIRRTLIEELHAVTAESARAAQALRAMRRAANSRSIAASMAVAALCALLPIGVAHWALPSASAVAGLRAQRDALAQDIERLQRLGGRVEWHRCGETRRLCVRIDRRAPAYGDKADIYVVEGN